MRSNVNVRRRTHKAAKGKTTNGYFIAPKRKRTYRGSKEGKPSPEWKKKWLFVGNSSSKSQKDPIAVYFLPRTLENPPAGPPSRRPVSPPPALRPRTINQSPTVPVLTPSSPSQLAPSNILAPPSKPVSPIAAPKPTPSPLAQKPLPVPTTVKPTSIPPTVSQTVSRSPTRKPVAATQPIPTTKPNQVPTKTPIGAPTPSPTPGPIDAPTPIGTPTVVPILPTTQFLPTTLPTSGPRTPSATPNTPAQATQRPSQGKFVMPTQGPTRNRLPTPSPSISTASPILQSIEKTPQPFPNSAFTEEPTLAIRSRNRVGGTSFFLEYNFAGGTATAHEYEAASLATLSYLNQFMDGAFEHNRHIDYDGQTGEVLGVTTNPATIAYSYGAYFLQSPDFRPISQKDVDRLLSTALSEPVNHVLVQSLSTSLDSSNPFSETTGVVYSLNFNGRAQNELDEELGVPSSAIALLIVGIFLGILGLGMIVFRRLRFRQPVLPDDSYDGLIHPGQRAESYDSAEDPAAMPNETRDEASSVWQWSVRSGHEGTCAPPESAGETASEADLQLVAIQ